MTKTPQIEQPQRADTPRFYDEITWERWLSSMEEAINAVAAAGHTATAAKMLADKIRETQARALITDTTQETMWTLKLQRRITELEATVAAQRNTIDALEHLLGNSSTSLDELLDLIQRQED